MLVAGLVTPAISITTMVVFGDTYSIVGAVFAFLDFGGHNTDLNTYHVPSAGRPARSRG